MARSKSSSPNSVAHWGVLTVGVKPLRSRRKFSVCSFFTAQGHKKRDSGGQNLRFACAKRLLGKFFGVSLKRRGDFRSSGRDSSWLHMIWTQDASREVKFAFRLRRATKNASWQVKICVSPAQNTRSTVFPAQGNTKRVSGGQNLRFACARPQNRMIRMLRHESETWILQKLLRYKDAETWIGRHGSCRGSWGDMNPETWILQRILRYIWILIYGSGDMDLAEDPYWWMLRHESDTWIRRHGSCRGSWDIKILRHVSGDVDLAENPWDTKMLRHESEDVDLVEDPEIHMAAELWIQQHGSCRGSWDTHGCWDMNPETWILQRSLRHKDVETWIRRCGSCRRSWDIKMLRHESETWILQRTLRYIWMLIYGSGDMDLAEGPGIHIDAETWIRRHGSCRGSWDTYGFLYTDPETWILQRSLRYKVAETWSRRRSILVDAETWIRRHGSCREFWDTYGFLYTDPETWILQRIHIGGC